MSQEHTPQKQDEQYLDKLRHSTAHIMAQAVQGIFGEADVRLAVGPAVADEFYYDMQLPRSLTPDDLPLIEKRMRQITKANHLFSHETWSVEQAREWFGEHQQPFKLELIDGIASGELDPEAEGVTSDSVSIYRHDTFVDLCKGPHVDSTRECRHFKLLRVSGAYWRGDQDREQLQRVYGTVWPTKDELHGYLNMLKEAEKRDHRKLGRELELFEMHPESPGSIFWLPKGTIIYNLLSEKARRFYLRNGYQEVRTPLIFNKSLWETSGHWTHFREDMFNFVDEDGEPVSSLKPMNCPAHMLIYKGKKKSYRDLPYRLHDQGVLHRNERTGALGGLTRVRQFCQDDAHNFITGDQIEDEIKSVLNLVSRMYAVFEMPYRCLLSTRPDKYMGDIELWNQAENALTKVLQESDVDYQVNAGDGAFYGPKIDFLVRDAIQREHQCATVQLDFQLPERFDLTYVAADNSEQRPVVVHRAIYGSLERFIGILIEHYAGAFPTWLAPVQCRILTISEKFVDYGQKVYERLLSENIRVEFDNRGEKIGAKIREGRLERIPYLVIVGGREEETGTVSVREREAGDQGSMDMEVFANRLSDESDLDF